MKLQVKVIPGASRNEICGWHGEALKIKIQSPPIDGKANQALLDFLIKQFHLSKNQIRILSGQKNRIKLLEIDSITDQDIARQL